MKYRIFVKEGLENIDTEFFDIRHGVVVVYDKKPITIGEKDNFKAIIPLLNIKIIRRLE